MATVLNLVLPPEESAVDDGEGEGDWVRNDAELGMDRVKELHAEKEGSSEGDEMK